MKWFLHFNFSPDHGEKWHRIDGQLTLKRMWQTCFINADSEKEAKDIAQKHMSEFTAPHLVELRPEI